MEHIYENIERYLSGELDGAELAAFEEALKTDAALAQAVARHREMMQRLEGLRLRNKVKSTLLQTDKAAFSIPSRPTLWVVSAGIILLAAMVWVFFRQVPNTEKIPQSTMPSPTAPAPAPPVNPPAPQEQTAQQEVSQPIALVKSMQEQPSGSMIREVAAKESGSPLQAAAGAYGKKDYKRVLQALKQMVIAEQDEEALYLRANAYFQLGQFADAARDFDLLKDSFQFKYEARWNYLLCQVALGNAAKSKQALQKMAADPDFPFRKKAQELRKQLNF